MSFRHLNQGISFIINPQLLTMNSRLQKCAPCSLSHVYKGLNHRINHSKSTLSREVEKNPGPYTIIDQNKTISAPYSQGNIALFEPNPGRQCVAMSLCALIYKHKKSISSSADLASILNTGNELYSGLSRLYNQEFLLFTELPQRVTVLETKVPDGIQLVQVILVIYMMFHLVLFSFTFFTFPFYYTCSSPY